MYLKKINEDCLTKLKNDLNFAHIQGSNKPRPIFF
jgi:hypothetical protein